MANIIPVKSLKGTGGVAIALGDAASGDTIPASYLDAQAQNLYGTYSARPAATSVKIGAIYYASDTMESYRSTGSAWALVGRGGAELGHAERTTAYSTTSDVFADVPGLAVDFVAGEGSAFASFGATGKTSSSSTPGVGAIFVDGVQFAQILYTYNNFLTMSTGVRISGKTPGSTVAVRIRARVAGVGPTFDIFGDPTDRCFLRVVSG